MGNCQTGCCGESTADEINDEVKGETKGGKTIVYKDQKNLKEDKAKVLK